MQGPELWDVDIEDPEALRLAARRAAEDLQNSAKGPKISAGNLNVSSSSSVARGLNEKVWKFWIFLRFAPFSLGKIWSEYMFEGSLKIAKKVQYLIF